MVLPISSSLRG
jgi:hypothetical protein